MDKLGWSPSAISTGGPGLSVGVAVCWCLTNGDRNRRKDEELVQDLAGGLKVFVSLSWDHRLPQVIPSQRAKRIGQALFGVLLGCMLAYFVWYIA